MRSDRHYNSYEIAVQFGNEIPPHYRKMAKSSDKNVEFESFISKFSCKLIETQRLIIFGDDGDDRYSSRDRRKTRYAISQKAEKLKTIISNEMNAYAALSQSLDRSFPRRVLTPHDEPRNRNIEDELLKLDEKRKQLMNVGILEVEAESPFNFPKKIELTDALASVLNAYIDDNIQKLASLDVIYSKIELFKELVGARFGRKEVIVGKNRGLNVEFKGSDIPIESLSSGEQHQLVLFFELLFETKKDSLILIDEPEISLHIAWQKLFISDLLKIIELNRFDTILATHSPQLLGVWSELTVKLGHVEMNGD